jgi:hypothetical protein
MPESARLTIIFRTNSWSIEGEKTNLVKLLQMYTAAKQTEQLGGPAQQLVWGENFCICMYEVVAMMLGPITSNPQEKALQLQEEAIKLMRKQQGEDEPWRESLKPDEDENNDN